MSRSVYDTKEWRKAREELKKQQTTCWCCYKPFRGKERSHAHHRKGVALDPDHQDLVRLCPSCHHILETIFRRRGNFQPEHMRRVWYLVRYKERAVQDDKGEHLDMSGVRAQDRAT